jgi:serine/threonine-protein kinase
LADASHPKTGASHKRVGSVVRGKYRVEAFLATGTMGNVYAATHRNGSRVALKILHARLAEDPSLCERFKREGYFANSIGHPGIVRAIDDDVTDDGCPFLVMELLEGETLEERRRRKGGKLELAWVLPIADSLLEILAAAHGREVVHRDLKPDNVFVTKSGDVKVLDFGVARWNDGKSSSDMTGVGMVLGTPAYMPPEQALGRREDVDAQSDLWAVGATLFVVLSGESVHAGGDAKAKLIATARTRARPLREAAPDIPRSVAMVVDRALAFHKSDRWPDAMAMREALRWARMSLEDGAQKALAVTGESELDAIPPPIPTRRAMDDEPTVMRVARPDEVPPASKDFLTSAPPITLRDLPTGRTTDIGGLLAGPAQPGSPGAQRPSVPSNEPVFSLRRPKDEAPSTERLPNAEVLRSALSDRMDAADIAHAKAMPTYDPADAMGDEMPASAPTVTRSVDVNMSFTRPMAAFVMGAELQSPRPAAGAPPPEPTPPPPYLSSAPFGSAPPQAYSSAPPQPAISPYGYHSLAPQPAAAQAGTAPAMRPIPAAGSSGALPHDFPDAPGPMLSQIVKPPNRMARILVPVLLAVLGTGAGVLALRARAASARSNAAAAAVAAAKAPNAPAGASVSASAAATPPPSASVAAAAGDADPKPAAVPAAVPAPPVTLAAAASAADPPKRPKPKKKKPVVVKPAEPAGEPTAIATSAPAATGEPAAPPETPPKEAPPKEVPPAKDPEPAPAPAPAPL